MARTSQSQRKRKRQLQNLPAPIPKIKAPVHNDNKEPIPFSRGGSVSYSEKYSGPLPHPRIMHQWEELYPGAASIVMEQFQAQGNHRRALEQYVIRSDVIRANWGLVAGVLVSLAAMGVCVLAIYQNQPWVAGVVGGGTIATLAGVFIYGSQNRRAERDEKSKTNP